MGSIREFLGLRPKLDHIHAVCGVCGFVGVVDFRPIGNSNEELRDGNLADAMELRMEHCGRKWRARSGDFKRR